MADLIARLKLANSEFNSSIDSSKEKVKEFQDTADDTSKSLKEMGDKGSKGASDMLKEMSQFENGARSVSDYRKQLGQLQKQIVDLTVNYRSMSAEMQNSAKGMEIKSLLDEATERASVLRDAIGDVQQEIKNMASDTVVWDGLKEGVEGVSGAMQAIASAGVLGEKSTEKLVAVIAKLQAIEKTTNAVIKIGNMLQKNSAAVQAIRTLQIKAQTLATGKATVAQAALNAVMKANPVVLLVTAIAALAAGLLVLTRNTNKAKEAQEAENKAIEKAKEKFEDYKSTVGGAVGDVVGKFRSLQVSYRNLSSEMEKKEWIEKNKTAFDQLGLAVTDVNSADAIFVKNSDAVIAALKARAKANALQTLYEKEYLKQAEAEIEAQKKLNEARQVSANQRYSSKANGDIPDDWKAAGLDSKEIKYTWGGGQSGMGWYELSPAQAAKVNEYYKNLAKQAGQEIVDAASEDITTIEGMWQDAELDAMQAGAKVSGLLNPKGGSGSGGGSKPTTVKPEIVPDENSLAAAQKIVEDLQKRINNMNVNAPEFNELADQLEAAKAEVERIQNLINKTKTEAKKDPVEIFTPNSMAEAQHFIKVFQDQLNDLDPSTDEFQEVLDLLIIWKNRQQEITDKINGTKEAAKTVVEQYQEISNKASDVNLRFSIGAINKAEAEKEIADLNKKLADLGLSVQVKLEVDDESVKTASEKLRGYVEQMDKIASVGNGVSAINSVYESISGLSDKLEEAENGWEQFFAIFQTGMTIFNAVTTIIETLATVTELLTAAKTANAAATTSEAAAASADAAAQGADAGATMTNAAAHGAAAAASAGQSVASIPYVGPILAIAAIASVMAAIIAMLSSAKGFANGGIVDAPYKYGDKNLIRVNDGEMILNQQQQGNLFKMLNDGRTDRGSNLGGDVEFKIRGTELVGVLNNINRKNSKI